MSVQNRKAFHDYEILTKYTAGIVLTGPEVKSAKRGAMSLHGSYVKLRNGEAYLENCSIEPYGPATREQREYEPRHTRKLLLKKKELGSLAEASERPGYSVVPLSLFVHQGWVKLEIALVRGKKKYDKREAIKKRETQRIMARASRQ